MSVAITRAIWQSSPVGGGELLVLLALADYASDDGWCWPSAATLAHRVHLSRRQVFRVLRALEERGLITLERGTGPQRSNRYRVAAAQFPTADTEVITGDHHGDTGVTMMVTSASVDGDTGVTRSVRDPQTLPSSLADAHTREQQAGPGAERDRDAYEALVQLHARYSAVRSARADDELRGFAAAGIRAADVAALQEVIRDEPWPYIAAILARVQADRAAGRDPWPERPAAGRPAAAGRGPDRAAPGPRGVAGNRARGSVRPSWLGPGVLVPTPQPEPAGTDVA